MFAKTYGAARVSMTNFAVRGVQNLDRRAVAMTRRLVLENDAPNVYRCVLLDDTL